MPGAERAHRAGSASTSACAPAADGVFAIGDLASVDVGGVELPMLSPPAMQEGRYVARAILAAVAGHEGSLEPFRYRDKGAMATIGRNAAVAELGRLRLTGFLAWVSWLFVHLLPDRLSQPRAVFLSWGWNYRRTGRLGSSRALSPTTSRTRFSTISESAIPRRPDRPDAHAEPAASTKPSRSLHPRARNDRTPSSSSARRSLAYKQIFPASRARRARSPRRAGDRGRQGGWAWTAQGAPRTACTSTAT